METELGRERPRVQCWRFSLAGTYYHVSRALCSRQSCPTIADRRNTQINDCWPCTSWSIADYFLRPKPSYYAIKRELRDFTVGITRKEVKTPDPSKPNSVAYFSIDAELEIWGTNSTLFVKEAILEIRSFDVSGSDVIHQITQHVSLRPNSSTELWKGSLTVFGQPVRTKLSEVPRSLVVQARIVEVESGMVLARYSNW